MQVTSLLSQKEHSHDHGAECGCGHDHEHSTIHAWQTLLGVVFVLNAFIVDWVFSNSHTIASASALIGAVILGYPICVTAIKDLKHGRLTVNELVAIAVLAALHFDSQRGLAVAITAAVAADVLVLATDRSTLGRTQSRRRLCWPRSVKRRSERLEWSRG